MGASLLALAKSIYYTLLSFSYIFTPGLIVLPSPPTNSKSSSNSNSMYTVYRKGTYLDYNNNVKQELRTL